MPAGFSLADACVRLDVQGATLAELVRNGIAESVHEGKLERGRRKAVERAIADGALENARWFEGGLGLVKIPIPPDEPPQCLLLRPADPASVEGSRPLGFVAVALAHERENAHCMSQMRHFARMLAETEYGADALRVRAPESLHALFDRYQQENPPPTPPPEPAQPVRHRLLDALRYGLIADMSRKADYYRSDFADGLDGKVVASTLFMFFACFAPAVAFGGLLATLTDNQIGAVEIIVSTAVCGVLYALLSGQPLTILGSTGPVIIFMGILYELRQQLDTPYLPTLAWIGYWTMAIMIGFAVTAASNLIRWFTRFTDEIFAALISMIFIVEAVNDILASFDDPSLSYDAALLSTMLALGTFMVAQQLSRFRRSPYLRRPIREFLADFGPSTSILAMTFLTVSLPMVEIETLLVPTTFSTTSGRPWIVNPFDAPMWIWGAAAIPALLLSVLLYLDHNITIRVINSPDHKLRKGGGYHLDMLIAGLLVGVCSLLGLPWMIAATVRSLNHVRSLAVTKVEDGEERIAAIKENRVSALAVHALIGCSLLFLGPLGQVPMSVLFGLFLYMGVSSLKGSMFIERLRLWFIDPERVPESHFLRKAPRKAVHGFTAIQVICLAVLWAVKASPLAILFPLFIALLVPLRLLLGKVFDPEHLKALDPREDPGEEKYQDLRLE